MRDTQKRKERHIELNRKELKILGNNLIHLCQNKDGRNVTYL